MCEGAGAEFYAEPPEGHIRLEGVDDALPAGEGEDGLHWSLAAAGMT